MKIRCLTFPTIATFATVALLAGCGGNGFAPVLAPDKTHLAPPYQDTSVALPMKLWASSTDLLYVSSNNGNVYVHTYPQGQLAETLALSGFPAGECVDSLGDVFIVTDVSGNGGSTIYEYAHGGTTPINTLSDPGFANGCGVDSSTGNLAVANVGDNSNSNPYRPHGDVAIYLGAVGSPIMHYSKTLPGFSFCGYDNNGNLFLSSFNERSLLGILATLTKGTGSFEVLSLDKKLYAATPPSVQWDGKFITVSSLPNRQKSPAYVYRLRISGTRATVVGTTVLNKRNEHHEGQIWIDGATVIGVAGKLYASVSFWSYPKGGRPDQTIKKIAHSLWGLTVSHASSR